MEITNWKDWDVGTINSKGKITKVHCKTNHFIIYDVDREKWFQYHTESDIINRTASIQKEWSAVINLISSETERKKYSPKIIGALRECFQGNSEAAKFKLEKIYASITSYKIIKGRLQYLSGAIVIMIVGSIFCYLINEETETRHFILIGSIFFGLSAGVLSVGSRLNNIIINIEADHFWYYFIYGATRIFMSAISSVLVYVLIKSNILFGIVNESNYYMFFSLGALSGFSESFIPNALRKVDNKTNSEVIKINRN
jgi:hypothetical protein